MAEDKVGRALIGSASGFYMGQRIGGNAAVNQTFERLQSASGTVDAPGSVRAATQFQGVTYIASFGRGVERIDANHAKLVWPDGAGAAAEALSLFVNGDQQLLIGTTSGVVLFDGLTTKRDPAFDVFKDATVRSIASGGEGSLWFATSKGIFLCANARCDNVAPGYDARSVIATR